MNETEPKQKEGERRGEVDGKTGRKIARESVINLFLYYRTHLFIDSIFLHYLSRSTDYDRD